MEHACSGCGVINIVQYVCELPKELVSRSQKQHNTIFGYIKETWINWPEPGDERLTNFNVKFQPIDPEHLRGWLLIRAGHCKVMEASSIDRNHVLAVKLLTRQIVENAYYELNIKDNGAQLITPKTLAQRGDDFPGKQRFTQIMNSIEEICEPVTGMTYEQYKKHARGRSKAETNPETPS
jgi:hypothetical protein